MDVKSKKKAQKDPCASFLLEGKASDSEGVSFAVVYLIEGGVFSFATRTTSLQRSCKKKD